jgi:hypothetical protein
MAIIEPSILPRIRPPAQLTCGGCGEMMLETYSRRFGGTMFYQPCFVLRENG